MGDRQIMAAEKVKEQPLVLGDQQQEPYMPEEAEEVGAAEAEAKSIVLAELVEQEEAVGVAGAATNTMPETTNTITSEERVA
ncbi:hypothetical protein [Enterocloster lavalensis]|uniref:hypothetical protein n=1 Tax=Enterocloster lavalensis TaxID=460384 RepID=UPI00140924F3|nr:hypothetical protein [Enterocloster lavalensis]